MTIRRVRNMYGACVVVVALLALLPGIESLTLNATQQDCHNHANCNANGTAACRQNNTTGIYTCDCYTGYVSPFCEDRDECSKGHNPCTDSGICVNTVGAYRCDCLPGLTGVHCRQVDNSNNCTLGYRDDGGGNCVDVDECTFSPITPCLRGTCTNTAGSYVCACPGGWMGPRCNDDIDECGSNPCQNGQCTNLDGSFACSCGPTWTARSGQVYVPVQHDDSTNTDVIAGCAVGGVIAVGGCIAVSMVIYYFVIKRRKQVGSEFADQDTVIEVEQQASSNNTEEKGSKPGHSVVGIPVDGGLNREYAMRTRFSIQRLFRQ